MTQPRVVAVVVTYNRRDLLLEALDALEAQARRPDVVVVVDNASTDGTADAVRHRAGVELYVLERNTGGAGGFAFGIMAALRAGADLIWLMDDDTIAEPDALAALLEARANYRDARPVLVASRVIWTGWPRSPDEYAAPEAARGCGRSAAAAESVGCVPVRSASFVSILIDADVCRRRGAPVADYFLWNDDFEFSTRILRGNVGLLCPPECGRAQDAHLRLDRCRPGRAFLLRGAQQGVDADPQPVAVTARARFVRRIHGAAVGPHDPCGRRPCDVVARPAARIDCCAEPRPALERGGPGRHRLQRLTSRAGPPA